jgi:ribosome biogenesis GTPase / thiamine phosphate phosphatase
LTDTGHEELAGTVVAIRPRRVQVRVGEHEYGCDLRRGLLQGARLERNRLVVGDRVRVAVERGEEAVLLEILPRDTKISRLDSVRPLREHVIAANIDLLLALQAVDDPPFNPRVLDRLLVVGEAGGVRCIVVLNKIDLARLEELDAWVAGYRRIGYPVALTCALSGQGLDELTQHLAGQTTILLGPSGVGKSTLLNRLIPGLQLRTGEISAARGRGIHTTTRVDHLDLPGGGVVLDTPGLRAIQPWTSPEALSAQFPEMRPHLGGCHFRDCLHHSEPGCAVRAAVDAGAIDAARYESYVRILEGLRVSDGGEILDPETKSE